MGDCPQSPGRVDIQAEGIGDVFPAVEHTTGQSHVDQVLGAISHFVAIEILVPLEEILKGRIDAPIPDDVELGHVDAVNAVLVRPIPRRPVLHDDIHIVMKMSVIHSQGFEYVLASELAHLQAAGPLDKRPQEEIPGVRV